MLNMSIIHGFLRSLPNLNQIKKSYNYSLTFGRYHENWYRSFPTLIKTSEFWIFTIMHVIFIDQPNAISCISGHKISPLISHLTLFWNFKIRYSSSVHNKYIKNKMPQKSYTLAVLQIIIDTVLLLYICDTKGIIISSKDTRSSFWHFASHEYSSKVGIFISLYISLYTSYHAYMEEREGEREL